MNNKSSKDETYSEEETARREDASLKRILSTPPTPHSAMKLGKRKAKADQKAPRTGNGDMPEVDKE